MQYLFGAHTSYYPAPILMLTITVNLGHTSPDAEQSRENRSQVGIERCLQSFVEIGGGLLTHFSGVATGTTFAVIEIGPIKNITVSCILIGPLRLCG